jgi:hypothetical protein
MEKGYVYNLYANNVPSSWDIVWVEAVKANVINPQFFDNWNKIKDAKKGLVHKLGLTQTAGINENGTTMHALLGELQENNWNNGVPILLDTYDSTAGEAFELHHIRAYLEYLYARVNLKTKPILRILAGTWNSWYDNAYSELKKVIELANPLIIGWGGNRPTAIRTGLVNWFEYGMSADPTKAAIGYIAYDATGMWEKSPQEPVVIPPSEDPIDEDEDEDVGESILLEFNPIKKWNVNLEFKLLGFLKGSIKGSIDAVFEDGDEE